MYERVREAAAAAAAAAPAAMLITIQRGARRLSEERGLWAGSEPGELG